MVPPPPSQAGKFKPRKPAKKIRIGEASGAPPQAIAPIVASSSAPQLASSLTATTAAATSHSSNRQTSRAGRGRGRGGAGRGSRAPAPQGQVFFTATPKEAATAKKATSSLTSGGGGASSSAHTATKGASSAKSTAKNKTKASKTADIDAQEEVVGIVDDGAEELKPQAVGSTSLKKTLDADDFEVSSPKKTTTKKPQELGIFYEDDSSDEEMEEVVDNMAEASIEPIVLPLPTKEDGSLEQTTSSTPKPRSSMFLNTNDVAAEDNWLVLQLPTRLPSLQTATQPPAVVSSSGGETTTATTAAEVSVSPLVESSFDNSLMKANPGRLGRIIVRKSGRTEFIFDRPDGMPAARMNMIEQSCNFRQEVVSIDSDDGTMVLLGGVKNMLVATPDIL